MLIYAIVFITSALIFYSVGVWSERRARILKLWHLVFFWLGFTCDTIGTSLMGRMANGFRLNLHSITGALAILLMLFHAVWGSVVLARKRPRELENFHKFSTLVWLFWLVPYILGLIVGMGSH